MNLSQLMLNFYRNNGKVKKLDEFVVTSGSSATIIENTNIATRPTPYDDDYGLGYTAFVVRDAGGASAAPENEFSAVSAYVASTQKFTIGTLTAALATGDKVALANDDIPVQTLMELSNMMLKDLGRIELVDSTSLTSVSSLGDSDYTLPVAAKNTLRRVEIQDWLGDSYRTIYERDITPAAPNSTGILTLPPEITGQIIKLWYEGVHATLSAYSSPISETIDDNLAIWGLTAYALRWYNSTLSGKNDYWRGQEADAWRMYKAMLIERPVKKSKMSPKWFSKRYGANAKAKLAIDA